MLTAPLLAPAGGPLLRLIQYGLSIHHREVVSFSQPHRIEGIERVREIVTQWSPSTLSPQEAYIIRKTVLQTSKIPGDIAEVGVFRGASAKIICDVKGLRRLHLFDTFEGLPAPGPADAAFEKGQYSCSLEEVRRYLAGCEDVAFYKGYFPATGAPVQNRRFSFVHLDVDLYESTAQALAFFYPRMTPGGVILSHDYVMFEGVRRAFDQFFATRPEPVIELSGNQCMVVKVAPS